MNHENPFPGMNPWMQSAWSDVHTMLIGYIRDTLDDSLPEDLIARAEEGISLENSSDGNDLTLRADITVVEPEPWKKGIAPVWSPENGVPLSEPVIVERIDDTTPRWLEVRTQSGRLITVIEVTSPANKTAKGRAAFENKMERLWSGGVNTVEIDLVRGRKAAKDARPGKSWPNEPCQVIVNRAANQFVNEVYPCPLRDRLPVVRIPLRSGEPDLALDLQPLFDRCYRKGRYWMLQYGPGSFLDFDDEDQQWAQSILSEAGLSY